MYAILAAAMLFLALTPAGPHPWGGATGLSLINAFLFAASLYYTILAIKEEKK